MNEIKALNDKELEMVSGGEVESANIIGYQVTMSHIIPNMERLSGNGCEEVEDR